MLWVVRAGYDGIFYKKYITSRRIYLPWRGFCLSLSDLKTREDFRKIVQNEKQTENKTTISTWAGQLYSFANDISVGDYILIPSRRSQYYTLAVVMGNYEFDALEPDHLYHSHSIEIICEDIPRNIFSQSTQYTLGAFRTLFRAKQVDGIMDEISNWRAHSDSPSIRG